MRNESIRNSDDRKITAEWTRALQTTLVEFAFLLPLGDPIRDAGLDVVDAIWDRGLQELLPGRAEAPPLIGAQRHGGTAATGNRSELEDA